MSSRHQRERERQYQDARGPGHSAHTQTARKSGLGPAYWYSSGICWNVLPLSAPAVPPYHVSCIPRQSDRAPRDPFHALHDASSGPDSRAICVLVHVALPVASAASATSPTSATSATSVHSALDLLSPLPTYTSFPFPPGSSAPARDVESKAVYGAGRCGSTA